MANFKGLTDRSDDAHRFILTTNRCQCRTRSDWGVYLLVGLEDVATERIVDTVTGDETEDLQILTVVRDVEHAEEQSNGKGIRLKKRSYR